MTHRLFTPQKFENNVYKRVSLMVTCEHGFGQFLWGMLQAAQAVLIYTHQCDDVRKWGLPLWNCWNLSKQVDINILVCHTVITLCLFMGRTDLRDTDAFNKTSAVSSVKVWTLFLNRTFISVIKKEITVETQQLWGIAAAVRCIATGLKDEAFHNCTVNKMTFKWRLTIL